jgi:Holliday junction resolvase RusA-like endonuclease
MIEFFVEGKPVPQGSLVFMKGRAIHAGADRLATWRADIARLGKSAGCLPSERPIAISLIFNMIKPKTVNRQMPTVPPDLDKLIRAVLDGLTGVAYKDDGQVVRITAVKIYGQKIGVQIGVVEL